MAYSVSLLEPARRFLVALAAEDKVFARNLALVLMSLRNDPEPRGSRELKPVLVEQVAGERIWERPDWLITYKLDKEARTLDVASIERR